MVGATGFEPAASWSQTKRSSQAELRPEEGEEAEGADESDRGDERSSEHLRMIMGRWEPATVASAEGVGQAWAARAHRSCLSRGHMIFYGRPVKGTDRKSTRLNSSHIQKSRMPSSA